MRPAPPARSDRKAGVPGSLVLLRSAQCTLDADGFFVGLIDAPLTQQGVAEAHAAATLIRSAGIRPDIVFSSELFRAQRTAEILAANEPSRFPLPIRDWRLNERNYGELSGRSRDAVRADVGDELFGRWHHGVHIVPPPMHDALYEEIASSEALRLTYPGMLPRTEALDDVILRVEDFYIECVTPLLNAGSTILLVAHEDPLRALCAVLDRLDDESLQSLRISGEPLIYELDGVLRPIVAGGVRLGAPTASAITETPEYEYEGEIA